MKRPTPPLATASGRLAASHVRIAIALRAEEEGGASECASPRAATDRCPVPSRDTAMARDLLAPLARNKPWWLMLGAAMAGAAIVMQPWRRLVVMGLLSPHVKAFAARVLVDRLRHPHVKKSTHHASR